MSEQSTNPDKITFSEPENDFQEHFNKEYNEALERIRNNNHPPETSSDDTWLADREEEVREWRRQQELQATRASIEELAPSTEEAMKKLRDAKSSEDLQAFLKQDYATAWEDGRFRQRAINKVEETINAANGSEVRPLNETERAFVSRLMESFGLSEEDDKSLWRAWGSFDVLNEDGSPDPDKVQRRAELIKRNLTTMNLLHSDEPQSVPKLCGEPYQIRHFNRYSPTELLWQIKNPDAPVDAISVSAHTDWNGTIESNYATYYDGAEEDRRVVYMEGSDPEDIGRRLQAETERRGPVDRVFVEAHSNPGVIRVGNGQEGLVDRHNADKFIPPGVVREGGEIIIFGCSSAGSVAEAIADTTGVRVVAPRGEVSGMELRGNEVPKFTSQKGSGRLKRVRARAYRPADEESFIKRGLKRLRRR